MAGSGLGAAREAMLMKFLVRWIRANARKRLGEVVGPEGGIDGRGSAMTMQNQKAVSFTARRFDKEKINGEAEPHRSELLATRKCCLTRYAATQGN